MRQRLSHLTPEELLLIPFVLLVVVGVLTQPQAITRLFEGPYATPIPGDSPADEVLNDTAPVPATTISADHDLADRFAVPTVIYDREGRRIITCMPGPVPSAQPYTEMRFLRSCVGDDPMNIP